MSAELARAVLELLGPDELRDLAERLAPYMPGDDMARDGWLETKDAATYLGLPSVDQLHKLTAARTIPFSQEKPGAKCYFLRSDLDEHRRRHMRGAQR